MLYLKRGRKTIRVNWTKITKINRIIGFAVSMNLKFEVASKHEIIVDGYEREGGWREKLFNECKYTSMQIFVRVNDFERRFLRSIIVDKYIANTSTRDKEKKRKESKRRTYAWTSLKKTKESTGFLCYSCRATNSSENYNRELRVT